MRRRRGRRVTPRRPSRLARRMPRVSFHTPRRRPSDDGRLLRGPGRPHLIISGGMVARPRGLTMQPGPRPGPFKPTKPRATLSVCRRRAERRAVIHAKGLAGRIHGTRRVRRRRHSEMSCR